MPFKKAGGKMSLEFEPSSQENKTCNWSTNTVLQFDWSGYHPISNEFLIMTTSLLLLETEQVALQWYFMLS